MIIEGNNLFASWMVEALAINSIHRMKNSFTRGLKDAISFQRLIRLVRWATSNLIRHIGFSAPVHTESSNWSTYFFDDGTSAEPIHTADIMAADPSTTIYFGVVAPDFLQWSSRYYLLYFDARTAFVLQVFVRLQMPQ